MTVWYSITSSYSSIVDNNPRRQYRLNIHSVLVHGKCIHLGRVRVESEFDPNVSVPDFPKNIGWDENMGWECKYTIVSPIVNWCLKYITMPQSASLWLKTSTNYCLLYRAGRCKFTVDSLFIFWFKMFR